MSAEQEKTTNFGYQEVAWDEKAKKVADVFHSVAPKYDLMNDMMSLGVHRLWKRYAIARSGVRVGNYVLDVAAGSGDLAQQFAGIVGNEGYVVLTDINSAMLAVGRERLINNGILRQVDYVQSDAECLPFTDNYFDCVSIAFGLRNVTDKAKALHSMYRVLKPGGRLIILEFSKPLFKPLQTIYDTYSFHVLPWLGEQIANDAESYRYLAESIRMHPDQEALKTMIEEVGFEDCDYHNLTGGIVALHKAYKY